MDTTTIYPYSKRNSFVTIGVLTILGLLFISNIYKAYHNNDRIDMIVFGVLTALLVFILVMVIATRLRPALNGDLALEFKEKGIVDYLRNITIDWQDIKAIDFKRTRSSSMIDIQLKWESDHGSQIYISLRWIEGNDRNIYNTALFYFNRFSDTGVQTQEQGNT
ncbi:hypothetical protein [Mucilaginibacter sp.]|uniref:hypothetical protein n=1 Tax=Mucilaginibacter sp. TaxID=1882438 RepID=UPI002638BD26|nr:hypothetical protein [Mucilaginibacter sp.]MDB4926795.1 hypothetical protein [Mucilaginibacter sp.]